MKKYLLFSFVFLFSSIFVFGQKPDKEGKKKFKYNTWSVGVDGGASISYTDIMDYDFYPKETKYWGNNASFFVNKQISPFFGLQARIAKGNLEGVKNTKTFSADYMQYGINSYFSITDLLFTNIRDKKVNFYFLVGVGLIDFRSMLRNNGNYEFAYGYNSAGEKLQSTTEFVLPTAVGMNVKLNRMFDFDMELSLNNLVSSDKLDAEIGGNSNDKYANLNIGLTYKFGKKKNHYLAWISSREKEEFEEKIAKKNKKKIDSLKKELLYMNEKLKDMDSLSKIVPEAEADDDGDGVPNSLDLEPKTPKGKMVNFRGISIDKLKIETTKVKVIVDTVVSQDKELLFSIYFELNKADVAKEDKLKLVEAAKKLKGNPSYILEVRGHADKTGSVEYNKQLSARRSDAVVNILVREFGIDDGRLLKTNYGEDDLLSNQDDSINRRVDFIIIKPTFK